MSNEESQTRADCTSFFTGSEGARRKLFASTMRDKQLEANGSIYAVTSKLAKFCSRKCAHCCTHIFTVSRAEAAGITYHLIENPEIGSAFLRNVAEHDVTHPERRQLRREYDSDSDDMEYFGRKIPCDFLGRDGDCLIYDVRPINCSGYISYAPARICALEPKGHIPLEAHKLYIKWRLWFEAQSRNRYSGLPEQSFCWPDIISENLATGDF